MSTALKPGNDDLTSLLAFFSLTALPTLSRLKVNDDQCVTLNREDEGRERSIWRLPLEGH